MKWTNVERVIERVGRVSRDMVLDKFDVAEWCYEVVREAGIFAGFERVKGLQVTISDYTTELPCNLYKIESVYTGACCPLGYHYTVSTNKITFTHERSGQALVDALVFRVDDNGFPLIYEPLEEACFWYVQMMMRTEAFLDNKLPGNNYEQLRSLYYVALRKGKQDMTHDTKEDINRVTIAARTVVQRVRRLPVR